MQWSKFPGDLQAKYVQAIADMLGMDVQALLGVILQTGSSGGFVKHPLHADDDHVGEIQWLIVATIYSDMDPNDDGQTCLMIS